MSTARPPPASTVPARGVDPREIGLHSQALASDRINLERASRIPDRAFPSASDARQHRALLRDVDNTATLVAQQANRMHPTELALSRYYIGNASAEARQLAARGRVGPKEIERMSNAARPVQAINERLASGATAFDWRKVTVTVQDKTGRPVKQLRVYVLPAGLIDKPDDRELIHVLLGRLTFEEPTSPSTGFVPRGEMRLWVGPQYKDEGMTDLVMARKVTRHTPVHGHMSTAPDPNLLFVAPEGVTAAGR